MFTTEDKQFLKNCIITFKDIYNIIHEYKHSYEVDGNEYIQLEIVFKSFQNYSFNDIKKFRDHLLVVMDVILDKLKEFPSEDNRYKVWNSIYDCLRELYFGENF